MTIEEVGVEDLVRAGLSVEEAQRFHESLKAEIEIAPSSSGLEGTKVATEPQKVWKELTGEGKKLLKPWHPYALHQLVYSIDREFENFINSASSFSVPAT